MQATFPTSGITTEEPLFVISVGTETITAFALLGADTGVLEVQIFDQVAAECGAPRLLDVQEHYYVPTYQIKATMQCLIEGDQLNLDR